MSLRIAVRKMRAAKARPNALENVTPSARHDDAMRP